VGKAPRFLAVAAVVCYMAGPCLAAESAGAEEWYETPYCTIVRGHTANLDDVADLLEDLEWASEGEEPVVREIIGSERGYEYTVVAPKAEPAPAIPPEKGLPFFAARPVARVLGRLLVPPDT